MNPSKITLGTVQLGIDYGIANINGKPDFKTSIKILKYAWDNGINTFDTSPKYGNSEKIIGSFISSKITNNIENLIISSKLPQVNIKKNLTFDNLYNYVKTQIKHSIEDLKVKKIPIYLIHHPTDIYLEEGLIFECLTQIKKEGLIDRCGISAYNPEEVISSLKFKEIDAVQVPINVFDHRFIKMDLLKELKKKKYLIFARSIYLQGLFFIQPQNLPNYLRKAEEHLIKLRNISNEYNIEIDKLVFLFVRDLPEITSLVIGAEKIEQVARNIELLKEKPLSNKIHQLIMREFSEIPEKIINPSFWNNKTSIR